MRLLPFLFKKLFFLLLLSSCSYNAPRYAHDLTADDMNNILQSAVKKLQKHHIVKTPFDVAIAAGLDRLVSEHPAVNRHLNGDIVITSIHQPSHYIVFSDILSPHLPYNQQVEEVANMLFSAAEQYTTINARQNLQIFMDGYLSAYDNYSRFLFSPLSDYKNRLGIHYIAHAEGLYISHVNINSVAANNALQIGDIITGVNGVPFTKNPLYMFDMLQNYDDDKGLSIDIIKEGHIHPHPILIGRKNPNITYKINKDNIYIKILHFHKDTADRLENIIKTLFKDGRDKTPLVIDLRGNFGGNLMAAISSADIFIDKGEIVKKISPDAGKSVTYNAHKNTIEQAKIYEEIMKAPLFILQDKFTASAAEIFAQALRAHRNATIIGDVSFGKDSIQKSFDLPLSSKIFITSATIGHLKPVPIIPDIYVENGNVNLDALIEYLQ